MKSWTGAFMFKNLYYPVEKRNHVLKFFFKVPWNCVICRDVGGSRDCYTEWSHKDKNKYHTILLICGIKKMIQRNLPAKQRDTDVQNRHIYTKRGRQGGMDWEIGIDITTYKEIANENLLDSTVSSTHGWWPQWGRNPEKGVYTYRQLIHSAVTAEANTTLQSNHTPIKINKICFENEKKSAYWGRNVIVL